jgi:hypothetical protein
MTITPEQARAMVARSVRRIVPDADVESVSEHADLRGTFELDSLDFLSFVELLVKESGVRLDEDDYPDLTSLAGCTDLLVRRSG